MTTEIKALIKQCEETSKKPLIDHLSLYNFHFEKTAYPGVHYEGEEETEIFFEHHFINQGSGAAKKIVVCGYWQEASRSYSASLQCYVEYILAKDGKDISIEMANSDSETTLLEDADMQIGRYGSISSVPDAPILMTDAAIELIDRKIVALLNKDDSSLIAGKRFKNALFTIAVLIGLTAWVSHEFFNYNLLNLIPPLKVFMDRLSK